MKRLNDYRMKLTLIGIVAGIVIGGGRAEADFTYGTPKNMGAPISTPYGELAPCITADGLEMYINYYNRPGNYGTWDIWISTRETVNDDWGAPVHLGSPVNIGQYNQAESISADGLELYCMSYNRSGGYGDWDLWLTTRATRNDAWGIPENLGPVVNSSYMDGSPSISSDGLELHFSSHRSGGYGSADIWVSRRATKNDPWEEPTNLGPVVNSSASDSIPFISSDGLLLFFSEERLNAPIRPGGFGNQDMWVTRRASISDAWGAPVNLGPRVNSPSLEAAPRVSPDGSTLYFNSERSGGLGGVWGDIYQAPIIPIVDLNADGIVDADDMCIMVDHWATENSLCDIGPMPWGDGVVDVEDIKVLAEHLFEHVSDPTLVAHWPLDEAQGTTAYDNTANCDGTLMGSPVWQPDVGMVDGALQFDGVDDYVVTGAAPNPEMDAYSVLAWIKGGAPGQAVLSQIGKANWLCAEPSEGALMTELTMSGRNGSSLDSQAVITDGNWHRISFVWDGSYRRLYVDGVVEAEDTQDNLDISSNGLYFGTGKAMEPGTFWSGLIDDVRIYNVALSAERIAALAQ